MEKYLKIPTVFERDSKTKKLIEGQYCSKTVEYLKDLTWDWSEKIDGTNIRVHWDGHKVTFGGRTDDAGIPQELLVALNEQFGGEAAAQVFEQVFGEKDVIFYGEGYGAKIQNGGNYRKGVGFILFDVQINGIWLRQENVIDIATRLGIDLVPHVFSGTVDEAIAYVKANPDSILPGAKCKMEGLVGRPREIILGNQGQRIIVKIKYKDFH